VHRGRWFMKGTSVGGSASFGSPGPTWHAEASGDFNADGNPDILWQNDSGEAAIWETAGSRVAAAGSLGNPGTSWQLYLPGISIARAVPISCGRTRPEKSSFGS
jgi:hypothetical protein